MSLSDVKVLVVDKTIVLGKGGFGAVFQGSFDDKKGSGKKIVAVKQIQILLLNGAKGQDRAEEEVLQKLDHPNIVKLLYYEKDAEFLYLAFELCEFSLDQYYSNKDMANSKNSENLQKIYGARMPQVGGILIQLAQGLAYIHASNLLHRDIKPHNVLAVLSSNPDLLMTLKWSDFGMSKWINDNEWHSFSQRTGTRDWVAQEISTLFDKDEQADLNPTLPTSVVKMSDVFSAGLVFFFVATGGKHPFGTTRLERETNVRSGKPININLLKPGEGGISAELTVRKMIAHNPKDRPTSDGVVQILKTLQDELTDLCSNTELEGKQVNRLRQLLDDGICIERGAKSKEGWNALLSVCRNYDKEDLFKVVRLLIANRIDVNCVTNAGWNALLFLCRYYDKDNLIYIIKLLIANNINVPYKNPSCEFT